MRRLNLFLAFFCFFSPPLWAAENTDYASILKENGYTYCAKVINEVTNWLMGQDASAVGLWKQSDADNRIGGLLASKRYPDGSTVMTVNAMKTASGGCDAFFSWVLPSEMSCPSIREKTFKDWKFYMDLAGVPIYDDPTTSNVQVSLIPSQSGCIVNKTGVLFYEKKDLPK